MAAAGVGVALDFPTGVLVSGVHRLRENKRKPE